MPGGVIVFVELKKQGGRVSARQRYLFGLLRGLGTDVRVVWTPEQVDAFIEEVSVDAV